MPNVKHNFLAGANLKSSTVQNSTTLHVIEDGTIITANIADNAVTTAKIADGAVTTGKIAADTILAADIATGAVGSDELASDSVITAKILDASVTYAKLANDAKYGYYREPYFTKACYPQSNSYPEGIQYNNKTYIVYQEGGTQDPMITYFDHITKAWATPVKVGINPLTSDSHGAPAVILDANHYIHVFWGCHGASGNLKHSKSTNTEDISAWTAKADLVVTQPTYPHIAKTSAGHLYVFYRSSTGVFSGVLRYVKSTDNGENWGAERTVVDFTNAWNIYQGGIEVEAGTPEKIHVSWLRRDSGAVDLRYNSYHAYLNLTDDHMYSADGTDRGITIDLAEEANVKIFDSGADQTCLTSVHVASDGKPYVVFGVLSATPIWKFARWTGAAWTVTNIFESYLYNYNRGDFILNSDTNLEVYVHVAHAASPLDRNFAALIKFISTDTGATWSPKDVIFELADNGYIVRADRILNFNSQFKITFTPQLLFYQFLGVEPFDLNHNSYAWGDNGFVHNVYSQ